MLYGIDFLRKKLANKKARVDTRYRYYEMKNGVENFGSILPEKAKHLAETLGWCAKAVDSVADRIIFDKFSNDNFRIGEIFELNNSDILFDSATLSALISSCSFIYLALDGGYPRMQVIDGGNATGIIDPVTNLMTEGYAVLERNENGGITKEAYFEPYKTSFYIDGKLDESLTQTHRAPYAMLVPIIYRPDARRPFGHSRISRACIGIMQSALRTLIRSEVSAEFYSFPQKYILGLSEDAAFNNRLASLSDFLDIRKDEDGDKPTVGQFSQQSMAPHLEQLRSFASLFAGETGLTLDDLGFAGANPTSFEAIKASHESLRLTTRKAQRTFGTGFLNAGYLAACLRDDMEYERRVFAQTKAQYLPIFEPDTAALGATGDAIYKINQAVPDFIGRETIHQLTGLEGDT